MLDFIYNGQAFGDDNGAIANEVMASMLIGGKIDIGVKRPYAKFKEVKNSKGEVIDLQLIGCYANINGKEVPVRNATLRKDEWKEYDKALVAAARLRLPGVMAFQRRGLVYNVTNGFGKTVLEYEDATELNDAEINMDGITRGKNDRLAFNIKYLPLPIVHKGFDINSRVLAASRTTGDPLDTTQVESATYKVSEKVEEILFTGASTYTFGSGTLYGLTDFPSRITGSLTGNWDDLTANSLGTVGEQILADVVAMKQDSIDARHYGPWVLFIPTNYETTLDKDHNSAASSKTIRQRILEVANIDEIIVADKLTADNVVLCQMTKNVMRMVNALPLSVVQWKTEGDMIYHFKVMTIMLPQPRADANGRTGIVHYS